MDFLERLKEHMEGQSFTPSVIEIGTYKADGDSVAIRPSPSNISSRYMAKSKIYSFGFQLLVHHANDLTAYQTLSQLFNLYDLNTNKLGIVSDDNSFALNNVRCTTTPNYVQETSHGVLWTAVFEAELYII